MRDWRVQRVGNGYRINEHRDNGKIVKVGETPAGKASEAQLMAAAPHLLEAASAVLASHEYIHLPDDVIWMLRDAIAKACPVNA